MWMMTKSDFFLFNQTYNNNKKTKNLPTSLSLSFAYCSKKQTNKNGEKFVNPFKNELAQKTTIRLFFFCFMFEKQSTILSLSFSLSRCVCVSSSLSFNVSLSSFIASNKLCVCVCSDENLFVCIVKRRNDENRHS